MIWVAIILAIIILLLLLIIITKVKITIDYYHGQDNDHLKLLFKAWFGLIRYKIDVPLIKVDDDSPTVVVEEKVQSGSDDETKKKDTKQFSISDALKSMHDLKELITHVVNLHRIVRAFLRKVKIKQFEWKTIIGVGDAAATGTITGAAWAIKGSVIGVFSQYFQLKVQPTIMVAPNFQRPISQTKFTCMFEFRIGHAIVAGLKLVKYWKGGMPNFKSKPLSVISDENNQHSL